MTQTHPLLRWTILPHGRRVARLSLRAAGLLLCGALSACGPRGEPPIVPPPGNAASSNAPSSTGPSQQFTPVADLETTRSARFMVQGEGVEAIVQHYNEKLGAQGWVTREPQSPTDVGQRKWVSTGASAGPSDAFDAAWKNPVTGQTALLSLWHIAGSPEVTHGTFDVYEKGQAP